MLKRVSKSTGAVYALAKPPDGAAAPAEGLPGLQMEAGKDAGEGAAAAGAKGREAEAVSCDAREDPRSPSPRSSPRRAVLFPPHFPFPGA